MIDIDTIKFDEATGLVPAIIIDKTKAKPLMLGYMNRESLQTSLKTGKAVFYSRSRKTLWTKGETSGNYLYISSVHADCDRDALLVYVSPAGPVCHNGTYSCFEGIAPETEKGLLYTLETVINKRKAEMPEGSYTSRLFAGGLPKITQKVGEEAVETIIAAMKNDKAEIINETADLLYHTLVMLSASGLSLADIENKLAERHNA